MAVVSRATLMALAIAAALLIDSAMSATYTVGGSDGWEIDTDFKSWASSQKFFVGDVLNFEYSENHDVLEVTEAGFSGQTSNPVMKYTGGKTFITLTAPRKRFFICGTPGHCSNGMKVEIDTLATESPPADTPPLPPPFPSAGASPPPEATPSSPPPSSHPAIPPTTPPANTPSAPPPRFGASPPAPPPGPSSPPSSPSPEPDSPTPPFPFDKPLNPSGAPNSPVKPPPPPSSAYKCNFRVDLSIGFGFLVIMLLAF